MTSWLKSPERGLQAVHLPLGHADYAATYRLQQHLHGLRSRDDIADSILTVEHDPVLTIGRSGSRESILVPQEVLTREGISVFEVDRGGDITYHGPGQLVVYPIVDLREQGRDLRRYIRNLEQSVIDLLADLEVDAVRRPGFPGVWVGSRKIASIGVHVRNWVTRHGIALNVDVDRFHFGMIRPCGLEIEIVSLNELTPKSFAISDLIEPHLAQLSRLFGWEVRVEDPRRHWEACR